MRVPPVVSERFWSEAEDRHAYAVLDGAQNENLLDLLGRQDAPEHVCLLTGELEPDMAEVAPYLVNLRPDCPFTDWLMEEGWAQNWGIFLASPEDLHRVWLHLRRQVMVYGPQLEPLYFRFYDPRVLRGFMRRCEGDRLEGFFGAVSCFLAEAASDSRTLAHLWSRADGKLVTQDVGSRTDT